MCKYAPQARERNNGSTDLFIDVTLKMLRS